MNGTLAVHILFMLLMFWWGRRITHSRLGTIGKIMAIIAIFTFFSIGEWGMAPGEGWTGLGPYLFPHYAFLAGVFAGVIPKGAQLIRVSTVDRGAAKRAQAQAAAQLLSQKRAAEADLSRQQAEAAEYLRRQKAEAEQELQKQAERIKREAQEEVRRARAEAEKARAPVKVDPHKVLGIAKDATQTEIKSAYRKQVAKYHPDKAAGATDEIKKLAEERFKEIQSAYEELSG